jgi:phosphate/sulfate permease
MLEHLGVELFLDVVGLAAEFAPKVYSGHWSRAEGTHATGQAEFLGAWVQLVPVTSGVGADMFSSPLILSEDSILILTITDAFLSPSNYIQSSV